MITFIDEEDRELRNVERDHGGVQSAPGLDAAVDTVNIKRAIWAAGVAEFFGSFGVNNGRPIYSIEILDQPGVNEALAQLIKNFGGSIRISHQREDGRVRKRFRLHGARCFRFFETIRPYLTKSKRQRIQKLWQEHGIQPPEYIVEHYKPSKRNPKGLINPKDLDFDE